MRLNVWFPPAARRPIDLFWAAIAWWGRHQKAWWLALVMFLMAWMSYDIGRVVTQADFTRMGNGTKGSLSSAQFDARLQANDERGSRVLITSENSARWIDRNGDVWALPGFGDDINRARLRDLRDKGVAIEGAASVEVVPIKTQPRDLVVSALIDAAAKLVILGFYVMVVYVVLRMLNSSGKRFKKIKGDERPKVRISDVAGHEGPKKELLEVVEYLRNPDRFRRAGARPPSGVLLFGPPGNGKTLLAKAIAGEADAAFLEQAASSFVQIYAGAGAQSVRKLFEEARKRRPCVVFIDEIDAVGGSRSAMGSHDERVQSLNALLAEMDGFADNDGIVVVAATNRLESLDEALVRPGRFDRKVCIPLPSRSDRLAILQVHAARLPNLVAHLERWADQTPGFSGADLAGLVNEAAIEAARTDTTEVGDAQFSLARDRIMMGARDHGRQPTVRERELVAYHELGHAVVRLALGGRVEKVSIQPRGGALGVTVSMAEEEQLLMTPEQIKIELTVLMGGRAAERVFLGVITVGASDDMRRASHLAREAIHRYGFDGFGPYLPEHETLKLEGERKAAQWVNEAYEHAQVLVEQHRPALVGLAAVLLDREELSGETLAAAILPAAKPGSLAISGP